MHQSTKETIMLNTEKIHSLSNKIKEIVDSTPINDANKNMHALLKSALTKMELVTREEFDIQTEVLKKAQSKITELEQNIQQLEKQLKSLESSQN